MTSELFLSAGRSIGTVTLDFTTTSPSTFWPPAAIFAEYIKRFAAPAELGGRTLQWRLVNYVWARQSSISRSPPAPYGIMFRVSVGALFAGWLPLAPISNLGPRRLLRHLDFGTARP